MYYLWNLKGLKEQWIRREFQETHSFFYLAIHLIILPVFDFILDFMTKGLITAKNASDPALLSLRVLVPGLIIIIVTFLILRFFFRANGAAEGYRFVDKLLSINVVISARLLIIYPIGYLGIHGKEHLHLAVLLALFLLWAAIPLYWLFSIRNSLLEIRDGELKREQQRYEALKSIGEKPPE